MPMKITPEQARKWLTVAAAAMAMTGGAVTGTYQFLVKTGIARGQLERVNVILAENHIGEEPKSTVVVSSDAEDRQLVYTYSNGDTLYYRSFTDLSGNKQKLKRWTSKMSVEQILDSSVQASWLISTAFASTAPAQAVRIDDEIYVGQTPDGLYLYYIPDADICEFQDPGTGSVVKTAPPPCDQYL